MGKSIYNDDTEIKVSKLMSNLDKDGIPEFYTRFEVIAAIEQTISEVEEG